MTVTGWETGVFVEMMAFYQNYVIQEWQQKLLDIQLRIVRWSRIMMVVEIAGAVLAVVVILILLWRWRNGRLY